MELGDFTTNGTYSEVKEFNDWLGTLDFKHKFLVAGKGDLVLDPSLRRGGIGKSDPRELITNAQYLEDVGVDIEGFKIWGTPWAETMDRYGAFHINKEAVARKKFGEIPEETDLLLSYAPPFGKQSGRW